MSKLILILFIFILPIQIVSQKLTTGIKTVIPINAKLETIDELNYYYADDVNSWYKLVPEDKLITRSYISLKFFTRYMVNDNWFISHEVGYLPFLKKYNLYYNCTYINNINLKTRFDYSYFTNSIFVGYKFLRIKEIRPKLYGGISLFSLFRFKEVLSRAEEYRLVNQYPYGQVIHQQIGSIKNNFLNYTVGFGFEYYILNFDIIYDCSFKNIGSDDFYKLYKSLYLNVGINLANILVKSKKVVKHKVFE